MLRKRSILFTALILLNLILVPAPSRSVRAHTNPEQGNDASVTRAGTNNYEPDNTPGQAKLITSGTSQSRSIVPKTDVDWIKFQLNTSSAVILETTGPLLSDTRISLYNNNLTPIEYNDDAG